MCCSMCSCSGPDFPPWPPAHRGAGGQELARHGGVGLKTGESAA